MSLFSVADDKVDILVVDDLPEKLLAFQAVLEELGQNLVLVQSGADALRELLRREFAVVLLDVNMPDIDGIETAELIRQHSKTAHTPIIFVTAYADELQTARGYELGAVDYILSPIVPQILRSKVRVFVDLYRAQRRAQALARAEADRAAAEEATRRSELIARASRELATSLDLEHGMRSFAAMLVPAFAGYALLVVQGLGRDAQLLACDADGVQRVETLDVPLRVRRAIHDALSEGRRADLRLLQESPSQWPADLPFVRVLPFTVGERTLGVAVLGAAQPHLADEPTLLELVTRAAIAFDNSQLYSTLKVEMARSKEAEEKLQQANRRKDEFLAMLSHELRNPLAPIRNAVELIRRLGPGDAKLVWATDVTERQLRQLTRLVDELLDVARISQGKIVLQKAALDLNALVANCVEAVRPAIAARRQLLTQALPPSPVWINGDSARLQQVISNLMSNAIKYTQEDGSLHLGVSVEDGQAVISVRDNGMGIEAELLPRVFDLFEQGRRALDRTQGGLGVGLTLVQRLVRLHDGRVEALSAGAGQGAEFRVYLPCPAAVEALPEAQRPAGADPAVSRRVMVVEDNPDIAETTATMLSLFGHTVCLARDGWQALARVEAFAPEVVLLDIGLPQMDGYEVARRLRQLPQIRQARLVALTGYGQPGDRQRGRDAGFDEHLLKPVDPALLSELIARAPPLPPAAGNAASQANSAGVLSPGLSGGNDVSPTAMLYSFKRP
jgi:signal transduction histidine kinase/DNA-binding response OmpR family regulator